MKKQSTAIVEAPSTSLVNRDEELKRQIEAQQRMLAKITTSSKFISFKGGNIIIDKKPIQGAKTDIIVLAFLAERTYFPGEFDPDERQSPACYAYADPLNSDADMAPHKEAKEPQSDLCETCEWNKWNTADKGRGKKCRESLRIALLPVQTDMTKADIWHARIPITSVANFKDFAGNVLAFGKSIHSVIAQLSVIPDDKSFFKVLWAVKSDTPAKILGIVEAKALTAQANIAFPYPDFTAEEGNKKQAAKIAAKIAARTSKQKHK